MKPLIPFAKKLHELMGADVDFKRKDVPKTLKIAKKQKKYMLMDPANVMAIEPLTEEAYQFIIHYVSNDMESGWKKPLPNLDHKAIGKAKYSLNYFKQIVNACSVLSDSIVIQSSKDYPIEVFVQDNSELNLKFRFILAPRVEGY